MMFLISFQTGCLIVESAFHSVYYCKVLDKNRLPGFQILDHYPKLRCQDIV